jgi:hypothetical protein
MPPVWIFLLLPFEAAILWIALDIRRKIDKSGKELKADVDATSKELTEGVARAMELGVSLLRQQLPKGDDDA